jgi:hypothetical protein
MRCEMLKQYEIILHKDTPQQKSLFLTTFLEYWNKKKELRRKNIEFYDIIHFYE